MGNKKISFFIRESISFISYLLVGIVSCVGAFFIVIQFLSPAISENQNKNSVLLAKNEPQGTKKVFKDIKNSFVDIMKNNLGNKNQQPKKAEGATPSGELAPEVAPQAEGATPSGELAPEVAPQAEGSVPSGELAPEVAPQAEGSVPSGELAPEVAPQAEGSVPSGELAPEVAPQAEGATSSGELAPEVAPQAEGATPSGELPPQGSIPSVVDSNTSSTEAQSPILEVETFMSPFIYDPERRRDPFEDPTIFQDTENIIFTPKTPPEKYDLSQLQLKGIIWDIKSPKALFKLPGAGGFYTLLRGDKVGKNGTIFEIREDEVVIVETILKISGAEKIKETDIKIIKLDRLKL